jgi:hypothetical protein
MQLDGWILQLSMWRCSEELRARVVQLEVSSKKEAKHFIGKVSWSQTPMFLCSTLVPSSETVPVNHYSLINWGLLAPLPPGFLAVNCYQPGFP